jgi:hypothetical protein
MDVTTYAAEAMGMALASRPRVAPNGSCSPATFWAPIALGTTDRKHGQPRRTKASP